MSYEYNLQDVIDFASTMMTEKKEKGDELFFAECPYCHGGKHRDKDTFSINMKNGTFHCFRSGCGKSGHFVELARDFGFPLDFGDNHQYRKLPQKQITTRPAAVTYLQSRGISEEICLKYHITTAKNDQNVLVFPFYDENNILQFVKYRKANFDRKKDKNKEWSEKGTKPILFGMPQCGESGSLIITEGQIDSLSVAECGFQNVVSVPNGALGFTWFQHCEEWLQRFDEVIVFGDCEDGKITLVDELQNRLTQKVKAVRVEDYLGEKDANDILRKYGKAAVFNAIQNAEVPKMKNVKDLYAVKEIDIEKIPKIRTGLTKLDDVIGGLYLGQVSLWSGKRGEGKSTLASQIMAEALNQDWNILVYSGELPDYHFKLWFDLQLAGRANLEEKKNEYGDTIYTIPQNVRDQINEWYRGRAYIYDNAYVPAKNQEEETIIQTIEKAIKQYGIRLICIDNLMTAIDLTGDKTDLYTAQSNFVWQLKTIALKYNVHIMLVAHPRKTKDGEMNNDDVSGSGDITNKVDTVVFYSRRQDEDLGGLISVTKNRLTGKLTGKKPIKTAYSQSCKRITAEGDNPKKAYGWENKTAPEGFEALQDDAECPF